MKTLTLGKVIKMIEEDYEKSLRLPYIRKPLAHTLYRIWTVIDSMEQERIVEAPNIDESITKTCTLTVNATSTIGTPCMICGETVVIDDPSQAPRICDKCKDAVVSVRGLLEFLGEENK